MPSKKSKPSRRPHFSPWKSAPSCAEHQVAAEAEGLARHMGPGDWVLLEGPMGVGKTFFARALIRALGAKGESRGSPTFPIAQVYPIGEERRVQHLDLYRLRSDEEIEEAGVYASFWETSDTVICEWASQFRELWERLTSKAAGAGDRKVWQVKIEFTAANDGQRDLTICILESKTPRATS